MSLKKKPWKCWHPLGSSRRPPISNTQRLDDKKVNIQLCIPSEPENLAIVRLTVAGIAHRLELDLERTDDLKLAVTEACGFLLEHTKDGQPISTDFTWEGNKLTVTVEIKCDDPDKVTIPSSEDDLGLFLIHALMDEVQSLNQGRTLVLGKDLSRRIDE